MEIIENIQSLCRLCGSKTKTDNRICIFDSKGIELNIKISNFLSLEINKNDYLPQFVCDECSNKLLNFIEFKEACHKTNTVFQDLLTQINEKIDDQVDATENTSTMTDETPPDVSSPGILRSLLQTPIHTNNTLQCQSMPVIANSYSLRPTETDDEHCYSISEVLNNFKNHESDKNPQENTNDTDNIIEPEIHITVQEEEIVLNTQVEKPITKPKFFTDNFLHSYLNTVPKKHVTKNIVYKCEFCDAKFQSHQFALEHIQLVLVKAKKVITIQPTINILIKSIDNNKIEESNEPKKCDICNKIYPTTHKLKEHVRRIHIKKMNQDNSIRYPCEYCNKQLKTLDILRIHTRRHRKEFKFICSYCNKGYVDNNSLQYHIKSQHTKEYPFICTECNKKFIDRSRLKRHILLVHTEDIMNHKCDICDKLFKTRSNANKHKQTHIPVEERKKFTCSLCDLSFVCKNELKRHVMVIHLGKLPYKCHICTNGYGTSSGLKVHLLVHSGVKNYVCETCGKAFALVHTLKTHIRTHTGERPFKCKVCNHTFTQSSTLNLHKKKHCSGKKDSD